MKKKIKYYIEIVVDSELEWDRFDEDFLFAKIAQLEVELDTFLNEDVRNEARRVAAICIEKLESVSNK